MLNPNDCLSRTPSCRHVPAGLQPAGRLLGVCNPRSHKFTMRGLSVHCRVANPAQGGRRVANPPQRVGGLGWLEELGGQRFMGELGAAGDRQAAGNVKKNCRNLTLRHIAKQKRSRRPGRHANRLRSPKTPPADAKHAVWQAGKGRLSNRYRPFGNAKPAVWQAERGRSGGRWRPVGSANVGAQRLRVWRTGHFHAPPRMAYLPPERTENKKAALSRGRL